MVSHFRPAIFLAERDRGRPTRPARRLLPARSGTRHSGPHRYSVFVAGLWAVHKYLEDCARVSYSLKVSRFIKIVEGMVSEMFVEAQCNYRETRSRRRGTARAAAGCAASGGLRSPRPPGPAPAPTRAHPQSAPDRRSRFAFVCDRVSFAAAYTLIMKW
ncbi:hypothetical protein EVAR_27825_1 [Eumeta japonica]|uniref:Uncharacterized protein n=1 Tax=Eumeta variegata TaxID=151549 RepID=A0A4C1VHQ6_EUMVA|nr:hypothetical protein EVAR_27825_1 [Eumeta japonica]